MEIHVGTNAQRGPARLIYYQEFPIAQLQLNMKNHDYAADNDAKSVIDPRISSTNKKPIAKSSRKNYQEGYSHERMTSYRTSYRYPLSK